MDDAEIGLGESRVRRVKREIGLGESRVRRVKEIGLGESRVRSHGLDDGKKGLGEVKDQESEGTDDAEIELGESKEIGLGESRFG